MLSSLHHSASVPRFPRIFPVLPFTISSLHKQRSRSSPARQCVETTIIAMLEKSLVCCQINSSCYRPILSIQGTTTTSPHAWPPFCANCNPCRRGFPAAHRGRGIIVLAMHSTTLIRISLSLWWVVIRLTNGTLDWLFSCLNTKKKLRILTLSFHSALNSPPLC
jgi:hypothetical protein